MKQSAQQMFLQHASANREKRDAERESREGGLLCRLLFSVSYTLSCGLSSKRFQSFPFL